MGEVVPLFDAERWVRRWHGMGGLVDSDGIRAPFAIWLPIEHQTYRERQLRRMFLALGPLHMAAAHAWVKAGGFLEVRYGFPRRASR